MWFLRLALFAALLMVQSGCRQSISTIHGKVTYDGSPVNRGQITFTPADGHGVARSGPIESGKYTVDNVPAGRKTVQVIGIKQIHFAKTHAEEAVAAKSGPPKAPESVDTVPANAQGNNQSVETALGVQELNFDLKQPKGG
jgi:hypothetical protein